MKHAISLLVFCLFSLSSYADVKLPKNCEAGLPQVISSSLIKKSDTEALVNSSDWGQSNKIKKYWIVFSDRDDNNTYASPSNTQIYGKLNFNETLRIAKISGDYALVYEEPQKGVIYPEISSSAKSKGWVPLKNLLLWTSCPTNEKFIYNKALIVMNLDEGKSQDAALCFKNPDDRTHGTQLQTRLEFYFVMKEVGNLSLLARQYKVDGHTDQVLYGWVGKSYYVPWDQRSCLETNWKRDDASYFANKEIKASVYETKDLLNKRLDMPLGVVNKHVAAKDSSFKYRMNPGAMRFPILENTSSNKDVFHCTFFGGADRNTVVVPIDEDQGGEITLIDQKLKEKSRINIIVVIDGTRSMDNFYAPMQKAVQEANRYFGSQNREVKVGVVIYRDYADGEYLTEIQPMVSPNDARLADFLSKGGKYGIKSSPNDRTSAEALYKGLEVALDTQRMGYSAKNSNLMFVVGDCGNDLEDSQCLSENEIVKKLVANNIQLASFQVRNLNERPFLLFRKQMNDFVRDNMKTQYGRLGTSFSSGFKEIPNGYEFQAKLDKDFFLGSTHYASLDSEMPAASLNALVKSCYEKFGGVIDVWLNTINQVDQTVGRVTVGGDGGGGQVDMAFLRTIFTDEEIQRLKASSSLMALQGYTAKKDDSGRDLWKPVIYISSDEFAALRKQLAEVNKVAKTGSSNRRPYIDAIKALIRAQVADLSEAELQEMSVEKVMSIIGGLNLDISATGKHSLLELQDENIVPQAEFDRMVQDFNKKYLKLKRIAEQSYPFKITRNNTSYYWLPAEDLP